MPDRVGQSRKRSIVKERGLQGSVAEGRSAKLVSVRAVPRNLLEPEVFVLGRPVENHVPVTDTKERSDLRNPDHIILEVADHLVGGPGDRVTLHTFSLAEEHE